MNRAQAAYEKTVLSVGYGVGALACAFLPLILWSSARTIPILILGVIAYAHYLQHAGKAKWPLKKLWTTFWLVLLFVRVDISFIDRPGPPRIVRYVIGLPSRKTMEKARRGEVVLHGCTATLLEPLWVLVW